MNLSHQGFLNCEFDDERRVTEPDNPQGLIDNPTLAAAAHGDSGVFLTPKCYSWFVYREALASTGQCHEATVHVGSMELERFS